jgi:predicted DNA-binding WGR domain protein
MDSQPVAAMFQEGHTLRFHSVDPERSRFRFYTITVQRTLWGEAAIVRTFGRIGTTGRQFVSIHPSLDLAAEAFEREVTRRIGRGYHLADNLESPAS